MLDDAHGVSMQVTTRAVMTFCLSVLVALPFANPTDGAQKTAPTILDVSLVQLIANPDRFDKRRVRVIGFCWFEFERTALHLHREDFERGLSKNAVWLSVGWPVPAAYADAKGKYAIVEGTFNAKDHGHMDMFAGSIGAITRLEEWRRSEEATPPRKPSS